MAFTIVYGISSLYRHIVSTYEYNAYLEVIKCARSHREYVEVLRYIQNRLPIIDDVTGTLATIFKELINVPDVNGDYITPGRICAMIIALAAVTELHPANHDDVHGYYVRVILPLIRDYPIL